MGEVEVGKETSGNLSIDINPGFQLPLPQRMYSLPTKKQED